MDSYIRHAAFSNEITKQSTHYHDCHQIIFIKKGLIEVAINGKSQTAQTGDIVIISRFENHSIKILSPEYERYILRINNNIPYKDRVFSVFINRPKRFNNVISVTPFEEKIDRLLSEVISEQAKKDAFSHPMQNLLLNALMMDVCRLLPEEIYTFNNTDFDLIFNLQQEFENNYSADFSLAELADMYNVSISTLSHNFKKITGVSVFEYLLSCRMAAAKTFLTKTNLSISEIVEKCGFTDSSNFSRSFKKLHSMTPTEFRKKYNK